ncbi:MAG: 2-C-methyl-D-erythritol 4-phosphate cytidylyltransferase, partial [Pseudomonadota bacterium]
MIIDAIVVAAGTGRRFGGDVPKQYRLLAGAPVLTHTLRRLTSYSGIRRLCVVIHSDHLTLFEAAITGLPPVMHVLGAQSRQASALRGLEALVTDPLPDAVLIHDGARPMVSDILLDRVATALRTKDSVLPAIPVTDSLKRTVNGAVAADIERANLMRAQTPQGFKFETILEAHRKFAGADFTDDTALVQKLGVRTHIVEGDASNIKITEAQDLADLEMQITSKFDREAPQWRTGLGFDVHRLGPN